MLTPVNAFVLASYIGNRLSCIASATAQLRKPFILLEACFIMPNVPEPSTC